MNNPIKAKNLHLSKRAVNLKIIPRTIFLCAFFNKNACLESIFQTGFTPNPYNDFTTVVHDERLKDRTSYTLLG